MFKSATIKLTCWYLALIVGLSLAFSFVLYRSSAESISSGFDHQRSAIRQQIEDLYGSQTPFNFDRMRTSEISLAEQRLIANLTLANVAVLVIGGGASFYMARRTLRPIEQALEAQTRFTADASHELRTPLTAMQTEIEVALRDKKLPAAEARELLESNLEEVRRLQDLSNGLLALANQDKETFEPKLVDSAKILKDAIARTSKAAEQKQITINNQASAQNLLGDHDSLVQLFAILLDNAVKYSSPKTTIELTSQAKGGNALITVRDHGAGIDAADLPHIFERLYRADSSRSQMQISGYGLGLSIAKKIVELHKGAIDVTSKVGDGSHFTARLPLASKSTDNRK